MTASIDIPPARQADGDLWIDPRSEEIVALAEARYEALRAAFPDECGTLRFALPRCDLTVRYAGRAMADALTAAFLHRSADAPRDDAMQLEWRIGDAALDERFPDLPTPPRPLHPLGSLHRNAANTMLVERRERFVTTLDAPALRLTTIADGPGAIDTDLAAKPLLRFMLALMLRLDIVLCHAALIGGGRRGMLVTGQGGAGKSTIAAACVAAGAGFCSDDFVALESRDGRLFGHCLYATLMLTGAQMERFPALATHAVRLRTDIFDKHLVPIARAFPAQIRPELEIDAVAVPRIVAGAQSQLVPGSAAAMLRAIAPSTLIATPWREAERTRFLFEHVSKLDPYVYRSGSDFSRIPIPMKDRYGF